MPTLSLQACESFCSALGIALFTLGIVALFIRHYFRLGVISMCMANIFFILAIVFPKKLTLVLLDLGLTQEFLAKDQRYVGILIGLIIFALMFYLFRKLCIVYIPKKEIQSDANAKT